MEVMAAPSGDDSLEAKSTWYTSLLFHVWSTESACDDLPNNIIKPKSGKLILILK
jgi:hypothetical protein